MIYKSTLGVVPLAVGGILGASLIGGLTLLVEEGNRRGIVAFEMKY
jgi:import inner membrane translocase subunit TIM23